MRDVFGSGSGFERDPDRDIGGSATGGRASPARSPSESEQWSVGDVRRSTPLARGETARPSDPSGLEIDRRVIQMFALVEEAVAGATHALLTGDREAARALVANDVAIDSIYLELEQLTSERVVEGGLSLAETRWLLAVLSMLPELERSGDLAEHVAQRATRNLPSTIPIRARGYIERMGEVACRMWRMAADAYADRLENIGAIDQLDDEMDDLHVRFIAELVGGVVAVPTAIELALIGRFYERLGDHAVNITRRIPSRRVRRTVSAE